MSPSRTRKEAHSADGSRQPPCHHEGSQGKGKSDTKRRAEENHSMMEPCSNAPAHPTSLGTFHTEHASQLMSSVV